MKRNIHVNFSFTQSVKSRSRRTDAQFGTTNALMNAETRINLTLFIVYAQIHSSDVSGMSSTDFTCLPLKPGG